MIRESLYLLLVFVTLKQVKSVYPHKIVQEHVQPKARILENPVLGIINAEEEVDFAFSRNAFFPPLIQLMNM